MAGGSVPWVPGLLSGSGDPLIDEAARLWVTTVGAVFELLNGLVIANTYLRTIVGTVTGIAFSSNGGPPTLQVVDTGGHRYCFYLSEVKRLPPC